MIQRVIMVCLGNICRSPAAEMVLRAKLDEAGLGHIEVDSAGTGGWHEGEGPDQRSQAAWERRGYTGRHIARQFRKQWFDERDLIVAMDRSNLETLRSGARTDEQRARIRLLREFDRSERSGEVLDVPDPYFGGAEGFEEMMDLIEHACDGLVEWLRRE